MPVDTGLQKIDLVKKTLISFFGKTIVLLSKSNIATVIRILLGI